MLWKSELLMWKTDCKAQQQRLTLSFLRYSVVMRFIHDRIFPVLCHVCKGEDRDLFLCANYLHQTGFSADQLGLPEDFCVPLTAAVSEYIGMPWMMRPLKNVLLLSLSSDC